jgi:ribosome-associated protein
MIKIKEDISLDDSELDWEFVRGSGPGGQKINKASTAVQLRFDVRQSPSLPEDIKQRLIDLAGSKMTTEGVLLIDARRFRTQERNRKDALDRLIELVQEAAVEPRARIKTKPSRGSTEKRLNEKQKTSEKKRRRKRVSPEDEI